jgi:hypothetical protein
MQDKNDIGHDFSKTCCPNTTLAAKDAKLEIIAGIEQLPKTPLWA